MCDISVTCALPFTHIDNFHWCMTDFVSYFWMWLLNFQLEVLCLHLVVAECQYIGSDELKCICPESIYHCPSHSWWHKGKLCWLREECFFSSLSRSSCWRKGCAGGQLPLVLCLYASNDLLMDFILICSDISHTVVCVKPLRTDTWQKDPAQYLIQWLRSYRPLQERSQKTSCNPDCLLRSLL